MTATFGVRSRSLDSSPGSVEVLHVWGRIDSANAREAEEAIVPAVNRASTLVIEGSDLVFVGSAGLRVFFVAARTAGQLGHSFAVAALPAPVLGTFKVTGLDKVVRLVPSVEAVAEPAP